MRVSSSEAWVRVTVGIVTLAALTSYWYGPTVGLVSTASFVCGWWIWFYGVKALIWRAQGRVPRKLEVLLGATGTVGCVAICAAGFFVTVALVVSCCVVIDGIALRFKG